MVHRCLILASILFVNTVLAFAKDRIEIVDLSTGEKQTLATTITSTSNEAILAADDNVKCVYTLKAERKAFALRTIGYDAEVLDEKPLPGFTCHESYNAKGYEYRCALSPKRDRIVTINYGDDPLYIYSVADGTKTGSTIPSISVTFLAWASETQAIAVTSNLRRLSSEYLGAVLRIDALTGQTEVVYKDDCVAQGTGAAEISHDKRFLALFCGPTNDLRVIDISSKKLAATQRLRREHVDFVRWSPDGKNLAYMIPTAGRLDISAINSDGSIATTASHEIHEIFWKMHFLDSNTLACLTSNLSGRLKYKLTPLKLDTGQWGAELPYTERSRIVPIDGGKKLFTIVSDGRNNLLSNALPPTAGHPALSLAMPILLDSMFAAHREPGASVGVIDVDKGRVKVIDAGDAWMENLLAVDEEQKRFATLHVTKSETSIRTISFAGNVLDSKVLPGMRITGGQGLLRFMAYSFETDIFAYYDDIQTKALYTIDLKTNEKKQILADLDVELFHLAWVDDKKLLLVINADWSSSQALANSIVLLDTATTSLEVLHKAKGQFDSLGPGPSDYHPRNTFKLSPDRRKFLFSQRSGPSEGRWTSLQILDLQTKELQTAAPAEDEVFAQYACWNSDCKRIAYVQMKRTKLSMKEELRSGNMYAVENSIKLYTGEQTNVTVFTSPEAWFHHNLVFLDKSRLLLGFVNEGFGGGRSVAIIHSESGATKKLIKGKFVTNMIPVDGGRFVLCHL